MKRDEVIFDIIAREKQRQLKGIELIASENFVSDQVMEAMGSVLTNKYAEGYPGKRYYGGCQVVDESETLAIERVKKLFGAEYANVYCLPFLNRATHSWVLTSTTVATFLTVLP